jgi:hypothetical protein
VVLGLAAVRVQAQQPSSATDTATHASGSAWLERLSISTTYGELQPAGRSELFRLMDRAAIPGSSALRPKLIGGELHVRVMKQWSLLVGLEAGGSTVASVSRIQPMSGQTEVRQQTSLELTSVQSLGAEWQAVRWRRAGRDAWDHLRVVLGAGGGVAHYRLRQWGDFVDVERRVAFQQDFSSAGSGGLGYVSAGVEVPLRGWVALQGEVRRQAGSAPMSSDFASFDRLDLGGTRVSVGVVLQLSAHGARRAGSSP